MVALRTFSGSKSPQQWIKDVSQTLPSPAGPFSIDVPTLCSEPGALLCGVFLLLLLVVVVVVILSLVPTFFICEIKICSVLISYIALLEFRKFYVTNTWWQAVL